MRQINLLIVIILASVVTILSCSSDPDKDTTTRQEYNGELPIIEIGDIWMHSANFSGVEATVVTEVIGETIFNGVECFEIAGSIDPPLFGAKYMTGLIDKQTQNDIKYHMYGEVGGDPFTVTSTYSYEYTNSAYPLSIGKSWTIHEEEITEYKGMDGTETGTETNTYSHEVTDIEDIMLPIGTFHCYKIETRDGDGILLSEEWLSDVDKGLAIKEIDYDTNSQFSLNAYSVTINGETVTAGKSIESLGDINSKIPPQDFSQSTHSSQKDYTLDYLSSTLDIMSILPSSFEESPPSMTGTDNANELSDLSFSFQKKDLSQFLLVNCAILEPMDKAMMTSFFESNGDLVEDLLMAGIMESGAESERENQSLLLDIDKAVIGEVSVIGKGTLYRNNEPKNFEILLFIRENVHVMVISFYFDDQIVIQAESVGNQIDNMLVGKETVRISEGGSIYTN